MPVVQSECSIYELHIRLMHVSSYVPCRTGAPLTGAIPTELGLCTALEVLNLSNQAFTGPIPTEFENLVEMTEMTLSGNQLTGAMPDGVCAIAEDPEGDLVILIADCAVTCAVPDCCSFCVSR